jgi:putative NADPH-quinone reductase
MSKVVIISGHPDLEASYTNKIILEEAAKGISSVDIRRLDTLYPDYRIDVEAEQAALVTADVIVLQYPLYWYSTPALMKKWVDDVLAGGFAYGTGGDKLKGKSFILSFTVGGTASAYTPLGHNNFTVEQLLHPMEQTAYLCEVNYQKPIYSHSMVYVPDMYGVLEEVEANAQDHAVRLIDKVNELLTAYSDEREPMLQMAG